MRGDVPAQDYKEKNMKKTMTTGQFLKFMDYCFKWWFYNWKKKKKIYNE